MKYHDNEGFFSTLLGAFRKTLFCDRFVPLQLKIRRCQRATAVRARVALAVATILSWPLPLSSSIAGRAGPMPLSSRRYGHLTRAWGTEKGSQVDVPRLRQLEQSLQIDDRSRP